MRRVEARGVGAVTVVPLLRPMISSLAISVLPPTTSSVPAVSASASAVLLRPTTTSPLNRLV
ncbi:MAG: hypothetical protein BWX70_03331 [Verrucomicrobia bacterium ADurb.Bin070]|nr:MAG: hypothetical protein BWX70_03331 [Verrucomicrobia bacterium ADurb.Bin070]